MLSPSRTGARASPPLSDAAALAEASAASSSTLLRGGGGGRYASLAAGHWRPRPVRAVYSVVALAHAAVVWPDRAADFLLALRRARPVRSPFVSVPDLRLGQPATGRASLQRKEAWREWVRSRNG